MANQMKKYFITTPIYYVNDRPHLGHIYTTLAADVIARFKRLDGYDVHFLTGTDEHGQKIEKSAAAKGVNTLEYCDHIASIFKDAAIKMNFSYDDFIRTSEPRHKDVVKQIWQQMFDKGYIYEGKYAGWYSVRDEAFYDESEIVDGKAPTGAEVEWVEEPTYFFKLSAFEEKLLALYESQPDFIMPESKRNEVISFVKSGLRDLSVSRTSFKWGIEVPNDPSHVMYVWLDALFNYYSAVSKPELQKYWPADLHIVGKDILRFHAIYWPAFLMAVDLPLPSRVFAHGWWLVEGEKMSKSIGNVLDPLSLVEKFGLDQVRYFLMREMPFGNDHSFSSENFFNRINSELSNTIGNLVQRVVSFVNKNADSKVPEFSLIPEDEDLLNEAYGIVDKMRVLMDQQAIHLAFEEVFKLAKLANEYIDKNAPWNLKKTDVARMNTVLYVLLELIRVIAILLQPLIPDSSSKILSFFMIKDVGFEKVNKDNALRQGADISSAEIVFPRLEDKA